MQKILAHKHERTLQFFTFFPAIYSTYNGSARKKSSRIFSCACVRIRLNEFSPSNIYLYIIAAAQERRGGSNQLWIYITQGRYKLGSNRHRWCNMAMMQSAFITCLLYIIQTSYQPTTAHHFIMEKCVNIHKSSMKKCEAVGEYSYEKCERCLL